VQSVPKRQDICVAIAAAGNCTVAAGEANCLLPGLAYRCWQQRLRAGCHCILFIAAYYWQQPSGCYDQRASIGSFASNQP
jgi:hypothetical protein